VNLNYTCRYCGDQRKVNTESGHIELGLRGDKLVVLELATLPACPNCATKGNLREVLDNEGYVLKRQVQYLDTSKAGELVRTREGSFPGVPAVRDVE
jgi:hypothetical protein